MMIRFAIHKNSFPFFKDETNNLTNQFTPTSVPHPEAPHRSSLCRHRPPGSRTPQSSRRRSTRCLGPLVFLLTPRTLKSCQGQAGLQHRDGRRDAGRCAAAGRWAGGAAAVHRRVRTEDQWPEGARGRSCARGGGKWYGDGGDETGRDLK